MKRTMAWDVHGDGLLVVVHGPQNPANDEWASYVEDGRRARQGALVVTAGGGPDSVQRGAMTDMFQQEGLDLRVAVVTTSRFVRGIVTAINWFNKGTRAFSPDELDRAMDHLGVPSGEHAAVRELVDRMAQSLGVEELRLAG